MGILSKSIVKNVGWFILGKFTAQTIIPLSTILIARILNPVDFGLFAIVSAIIGFIDIIKDLGIAQAIIIERDDNNLISLQFTVQLILGLFVYGFIFILATPVALYFGLPELKTALMIYSLMIFVYCVEYPLETFYMKKNQYNIIFYRQLLPALFYGVITYLLALKGFGVLALIIGHLLGRMITAFFLLAKSGWKPKFYFNLNQFKHLFNLGRHILAQSVSGFFVTQADPLIVGKLLGVYNLGFYKTGNVFAQIIPNAVTPQVQKVVFSDVAPRKDNRRYCNHRFVQFSYVIGPLSLALSILMYYLSPLLITWVMGHKWNQMIPVVQILAAALPTGMIVGLNSEYAKILGFNHVYTLFSVIRSAITLIAVYIGALFSLKLAVISWVAAALLANVTNEICFFKSQKIIVYRNYRLVFFIFAWLWSVYIIIHQIIKA